MRMIWVLFAKEVKSLFSSWVAYAVLIAFTLLGGINYYNTLRMFEILTRYAKTIEEGAKTQDWNLVEQLIIPLYSTIFVLLFIIVPAITMRLFAEEKKQRTEELLLTSPIRVVEIVLAKYLAAVSLVLVMLIPAAIFPAVTLYYGQPTPDWGPMVTGYVALYFLGFSLAAVGVFASSVTENQIVAFIVAVALEMLLFLVTQATIAFDIVHIGNLTINLGGFLRAFSITEHFDPMLNGLLKLSDVFYFASLIFFWLWASTQSVQSTRWG